MFPSVVQLIYGHLRRLHSAKFEILRKITTKLCPWSTMTSRKYVFFYREQGRGSKGLIFFSLMIDWTITKTLFYVKMGDFVLFHFTLGHRIENKGFKTGECVRDEVFDPSKLGVNPIGYSRRECNWESIRFWTLSRCDKNISLCGENVRRNLYGHTKSTL